MSNNIKLQHIFDTISHTLKKSSAIFEENQRDFPEGNPLSLIIKDQLSKISTKTLIKEMDDVVLYVQKTGSPIIQKWLIEQPSFQEWQNETDCIFFEAIKDEEMKTKFFNSLYSESKEKQSRYKKDGFVMNAIENQQYFSHSLVFNYLPYEDKEMWSKVLDTFHEKQKVKKIGIIALNLRATDKKTVVNNIANLLNVSVEKNIITQKEANTIYTMEILGNNKSNESFLFPKEIIDKMIVAKNQGLNLNPEIISKFSHQGKSWAQQLLERDPEAFRIVILPIPDMDFSEWLDKEKFSDSFERYRTAKGNYHADIRIDEIHTEILQGQSIFEKKKLKNKIAQSIADKNDSTPQPTSTTFKI